MHSTGSRGRFDLLVLTASDGHQADIYRELVGSRLASGGIAADDLLVVPDPGGRRVGSGGATLEAFLQAARRVGGDRPFEGRRILVVHSGGESRRLPAFAALGKILMPLGIDGVDGGPRTMLETIVHSIARRPGPTEGQVVVTTGDAFMDLDAVDLAGPGITGVAQSASLERGARHGVYVADRSGRLVDMLQKPGEEEARRCGAIRRGGRVLVDTGILSFDPASAMAWLESAGVVRSRGRWSAGGGLLDSVRRGTVGPVELYHEMLKAIPASVTARDFERVVRLGGEGLERRRRLSSWRRGVRGLPFRVEVDSSPPFRHPGTTAEYLDLVGRSRTPVVMGGDVAIDGGGKSVVEGSIPGTTGRIVLAGRNLVAGLPALRTAELRLARGTCLLGLPVTDLEGRAAWVMVAHHERDDFKTPLDDGGTFGGLRAPGLDEEAATLREARLWLPATPGRSTRHAIAVLDARRRPAAGNLWSLEQALARLDVRRLVDHRTETDRRHLESHAADALEASDLLSARSVAERIGGARAQALAVDLRDRASTSEDPLARARLLAAVSCVEDSRGRDRAAGRAMKAALAQVGEAVAGPVPEADDARAAIVLPDQATWAAAPVRVDLAGGWSDTPPMCVEQGGTVVNTSVLLHGKQPIQAVAKLLDEPRIVVHSVDLGESRSFTRTADLHAPADPADWTTLPRTALRLAGVVPRDPRASLRRRLDRLGGGLSLTLHSAVPKGSGLGTSSILGATVLACLERLFTTDLAKGTLIERTSVLEQCMTTRGGWQDQVGGVEGGLKISRTSPGRVQRPVVERLEPPAGFLEEIVARTVLLYSGEKRLARDILEKVVGRYLSREPEAVRIVHRLKEGAEAMAAAVREGDVAGFGERLREYWTLKTAFDPASTNERIEAMVAPHRRDLEAWQLPGAGGGGFVMMLARDRDAMERIRRRIARHAPNRLARPFPLEVCGEGLRVTVL